MIGKCLCGDIPNLYQCHCSLCRKQGGAYSNAATIIHEDQFSWKSGQDKISYFRKETGFSSDFCATCGSPVPNRLRNTERFWIPAGLLEDGNGLEIVAHLYTKFKAPWDKIPGTGSNFEEMPDMEEFQNILERRK